MLQIELFVCKKKYLHNSEENLGRKMVWVHFNTILFSHCGSYSQMDNIPNYLTNVMVFSERDNFAVVIICESEDLMK